MSYTNTVRFCIVCMLLGLLSGWVQAANRPLMDRHSGSEFWPRRMETSFASPFGNIMYERQAAYGPNGEWVVSANWTGNRPPAPYPQRYQPHPQSNTQPYLEVEVSESSPFIQQTVIYTFRIVSSGNLQVVNPVLPSHEGIILKSIDGPIPTARRRGGQQEIVNEFRFALTPMKTGNIEIPPMRVTGKRVTGRQTYSFARGREYQESGFDISSNAPLVLQVKPAAPAVRPWLPLHDLRIEGGLEKSQKVQAGRPLTLSLSLTAEGGDADRLPSMESQLQVPGFRVYRESNQSHNTLSVDGKRLLGYRKETYTLVPARVTALKLPSVRLAWWNVVQNKREMTVFSLDHSPVTPASVNIPKIDEQGVLSSKITETVTRFNIEQTSLPPFWLVLLVVFGSSAFVWFWIWSRDRPLGDKIRQWVKPAVQSIFVALKNLAQRIAQALSLRQLWQNLRHRAIMAMPTPFKLWFCARCLDEECRPSDWCQMFKFLACKHLKISQQVTLSKIADEIIVAHPGVEAASVKQLMSDLVGAVYGGKPLDFEAWKRDFKRQLRPKWFRHKAANSEDSGGLPQLNPHIR